ncbi:hypothetical protein [Gelidibacter japonicus]|uniref:hypothetical protein n=1 Tax=Gelidibacter japonicus TaxID=1962232 RepID=UPI003A90971D
MDTNTLTVKKLLHYTFGFVPTIAGIDKFTNVLTDWTHYVSPNMADIIPFEVSTFMIIVGVIEIIAGILVIIRPMIGAYIVMAWLVLIALTLIVSGSYLDIAVRDLVMAIAAFSLAKLSAPTLNKPKN